MLLVPTLAAIFSLGVASVSPPGAAAAQRCAQRRQGQPAPAPPRMERVASCRALRDEPARDGCIVAALRGTRDAQELRVLAATLQAMGRMQESIAVMLESMRRQPRSTPPVPTPGRLPQTQPSPSPGDFPLVPPRRGSGRTASR